MPCQNGEAWIPPDQNPASSFRSISVAELNSLKTVLGVVAVPSAVLIRPDGYVAWVGEQTQVGLADALNAWLGPRI